MPAPPNVVKMGDAVFKSFSGGTPGTTYTDTVRVRESVETHGYSGTRTANWRAHRFDAIKPLNFYSRFDSKSSSEAIAESYTNTPNGAWGSGRIPLNTWGLPVPRHAATYVGDSRAAASMTDEQLVTAACSILSRDMNVGPLLVDLGRTVQMLKGVGEGAIGAIQYAGKRVFNHKTSARPERMASLMRKVGEAPAREQSNFWLAVEYGFKPLVGDMKNLGRYFGNEGMKRGTFIKKSKSDKGGFTDVFSTSHTLSLGRVVRINTTVTAEVQKRAIAMGLTSHVPHLYIGPLTTAWDAVFYTFVLDWFLNIYDVLNLIETQGDTYHRVSAIGTSVKITSVSDYVATSSGTLSTFAVSGRYTSSYESVSRVPLGPSFIPSFYSAKKAFSLGHMLNLVALMRQTRPARLPRPASQKELDKSDWLKKPDYPLAHLPPRGFSPYY